MTATVTKTRWAELSDFITERMGLCFPRERQRDLERGMASVARECGFADVESCISWLLSTPLSKHHIEILASHLTVGETYFFRERQTFQALQEHILPGLIHARRGADQRLRFWSAGCATGEELYSLAIALKLVLPDWRDWHITILGTDINPSFLTKAFQGTYGAWSFREPPARIREDYFSPDGPGRWQILPAIKEKVSFSYLNLAEDNYPSLLNNTNAMDVIFCRNVLMYFSSALARRAIHNLYRALREGGWLVVGLAEASHELCSEFEPVNFPGAILYRKVNGHRKRNRTVSEGAPEGAIEPCMVGAADPAEQLANHTLQEGLAEDAPPPLVPAADPAPEPLSPKQEALTLYQQGRYSEAAEAGSIALAQGQGDVETLLLVARIHANRGGLADALAACDQALALDKLNARGHYLRAAILQEQGGSDEAQAALRSVLYLAPDFVLAHFSLGNAALAQGDLPRSRKHFDNARVLLRSHSPEEPLPESEGITAGRMEEIIESIYPGEQVA